METGARLLLDVLVQRPRTNFSFVDVAERVHGNASAALVVVACSLGSGMNALTEPSVVLPILISRFQPA